LIEINIQMSHRVAADHDSDVGGAFVRPWVRERIVSPLGDDPGQVFMLSHGRVTMIATDPHVHAVPSAVLFGVAPDLRHCLVDDAHCFADDRRVVSGGMRCFVDSGERDEGEPGFLCAQPVRDFMADPAVDLEPAFDIATKVGCRGACNEPKRLPYSFTALQSATYHTECAETGFGQLENRRRRAVEVAVDEPHLRTDIAARVTGQPRDISRAIEPPQTGKAHASWIASHQERRVGRPRY
jgi:hypothetical protein